MTDPLKRTDGELLAEFAASGSEVAFADLVRRHGAMVYGVCFRIVGDHHEAQDVTQAVFATLAAKAATLYRDVSAGGWLHVVARRLAINVLKARQGRQRREEVAMQAHAQSVSPTAVQGLFRAELDTAIGALPERYRQPLVLFHLEGQSLAQTARQLGLGVSTTGTRLARARELLRRKLERRGMTIGTIGVLTAMLAAEARSAVFPEAVVAATVKAVVGGGASAISLKVAALTSDALRMLFVAKIEKAALVAAAGASLIGGGLLVAERAADRRPPVSPPAVSQPAPILPAPTQPIPIQPARPMVQGSVTPLPAAAVATAVPGTSPAARVPPSSPATPAGDYVDADKFAQADYVYRARLEEITGSSHDARGQVLPERTMRFKVREILKPPKQSQSFLLVVAPAAEAEAMPMSEMTLYATAEQRQEGEQSGGVLRLLGDSKETGTSHVGP